MKELFDKIGLAGLVPVIKLATAGDAVPLGKALAAGGITVMEVTFRTKAAEEAIRRLRGEAPEILTGAGTVINVEMARNAVSAGAQFVVSPSFDDAVVDFCLEKGVPIAPGISNAEGVARAVNKGLDVVKFFPAEASGGTAMLDALAGPFAGVKFIPTGGIDAGNLASYAAKEQVLAVGGSWMVKSDLIEANAWPEITRLSREAVLALHGFCFAHLGINGADASEARKIAGLFNDLFGFPFKEGTSSLMLNQPPDLEVMLTPFRGRNGHLAMGVHSVERALAYLEARGVASVAETHKTDGKRLKSAYLDLEIGGFAVHLLRL